MAAMPQSEFLPLTDDNFPPLPEPFRQVKRFDSAEEYHLFVDMAKAYTSSEKGYCALQDIRCIINSQVRAHIFANRYNSGDPAADLRAYLNEYNVRYYSDSDSDDRDSDRDSDDSDDSDDDTPINSDVFVTKYPGTDTTNQECTICIGPFTSENAAFAVSCGHMYHEACIKRWLGVKLTCCTCRAVLLATDASTTPERAFAQSLSIRAFARIERSSC